MNKKNGKIKFIIDVVLGIIVESLFPILPLIIVLFTSFILYKLL